MYVSAISMVLLRGISTPLIRAMLPPLRSLNDYVTLALPLLVLWILRTNNANNTASLDHFTVFAAPLHRCPNLHIDLPNKHTETHRPFLHRLGATSLEPGY
jgi:hypothetical protein